MLLCGPRNGGDLPEIDQVAGLGEAQGAIPLRTAVSILVAAIIYASLMLLVLKVAASLTRGWRLGKAPSFASAVSGGGLPAYQAAALNPAPAATAASSAAISSDRVRSTVASLETMTSSHRLAPPVAARLAIPAPAPVPSLPAPSDVRNQLRYLHHRVAGVSNNASREMLR